MAACNKLAFKVPHGFTIVLNRELFEGAMRYWTSQQGQIDKEQGRIYELAEVLNHMLEAADQGVFLQYFTEKAFIDACYLWISYHMLYTGGEQYMVPIPDPEPSLDFLTKPKR